MKKRIAAAVLAVIISAMSVSPLFAHSGGLDSNGGHWNHKTGTYHYHRGPRY